METFTVTVTLVVKATNARAAERGVVDRLELHGWLAEPPAEAPYPNGTLLYFGTRVEQS